MVGHNDPEGKIVRAEDGFLCVVTVSSETENEGIKTDDPMAELDLIKTKDAMEKYARKFDIELDKRRKLVDMKMDFQKAMAEKDELIGE